MLKETIPIVTNLTNISLNSSRCIVGVTETGKPVVTAPIFGKTDDTHIITVNGKYYCIQSMISDPSVGLSLTSLPKFSLDRIKEPKAHANELGYFTSYYLLGNSLIGKMCDHNGGVRVNISMPVECITSEGVIITKSKSRYGINPFGCQDSTSLHQISNLPIQRNLPDQQLNWHKPNSQYVGL